jgi:Kef-type K+ transport system membrane component KefB
MHSHLLQDIGLCIVAATVLAYIARLLRQPLLLAYIAAGIVIGPIGLKQITEPDSIQILAEIGLALLMFIVGLEIDIKKMLSAGVPAAVVTTVQVAGSAFMGWAAAALLGYSGLPALYLGAAVALSSTMIVVKLLADRSELDTLPGRTTLAILLFQDVFAIVALAIQPSLGRDLPIASIALIAFRGLGLVVVALLVSRFLLPLLFRWVAKTPEILLLSAITWCFVVGYAALQLEFSLAMGALIAGMSISALPYTLDVVAKIQSLRDFFVTLFFVSLGMLIEPPTAGILVHAVVLATVVVLSRFLLIWPVLRLLGFDNRIGALSSIHLAQTSEFGLLIALIGLTFAPPHIERNILSLVVIVLVITSTASTYMIHYSHALAARLVRALSRTGYKDRHKPGDEAEPLSPAEIVLVGCFRVGETLADQLAAAHADLLVIDFNPQVHERLKARGVRCLYGDISHKDVLEHAGVEHAKILVCAIADDFLRGTDNRRLLESLRHMNPAAVIIVTGESPRQAVQLYELGADYVVVPRVLAADDLMNVIDLARSNHLAAHRQRHMEALKSRLHNEQ